MGNMRFLCAIAGWGVALLAATTNADSSGPFRGPQNNGVYPATGLLQHWPTNGPALLWKANIGEGYGGAAIVDDLVYVAGGGNGHLYVGTSGNWLSAVDDMVMVG